MSDFVNFFILLYLILTKIIWRGRRKVVYLQC
nr:MAG TPA: Receptor tyrosine-protein kinase erbB-3 [Caudoviricetes sp.]DAH56160.1 MAG TPA: Receptor tyrosine-protein kinase erbB-3 [Caudoviricetes sp.]